MNTLYSGDNLNVVCHHRKDESLELVDVDTRASSNINKNISFPNQKDSEARITASPYEYRGLLHNPRRNGVMTACLS